MAGKRKLKSLPCIDPQEIRVFSGGSHPALAAGIARYLAVPLDDTYTKHFSNDNLYVQLGASVRERIVYIVQSLTPPASDHLLELLMMLDIARGAAAKAVHAIIPYFSFARSDKKDAPRISITARLIADLLQTAGATHVMTMSLHSPQVHGFFGVPTDPLTARGLFVRHFRRHFRKKDLRDTVVIAPDAGRSKSAGRFAAHLDLPVIAAEKTRISEKEVRISNLVGKQVMGFRRAIIYDDEIATGGSILAVSELLIRNGIEEITTVCTHGVFTGKSVERLSAIPQITEIVTTDTVPIPPDKRAPHMKVLSVAPVFGEAIRRNYFRQSIGDLFSFWDE
ncbi:MAG TPA: ribose-phosphate pyrophosphokinase [Anaerolineales bacterium]|nr:ribose-phosphate pyrophosphokinase [Anaerolineales bacterium]